MIIRVLYRVLHLFGYLLFSWAFFVSSLSMELNSDTSITTATILFIKLIFMAAAVLYAVIGFSKLLSIETNEE